MSRLFCLATIGMCVSPSLAAAQRDRMEIRVSAPELASADQRAEQPMPGTLSPEALAAFATHYSGKGLHGVRLYESTVFTWSPELRRAVRAAGWDFTR